MNNQQIANLIEILQAMQRESADDEFLRDIVRDNRVPSTAQPPAERVRVVGAPVVHTAGGGTGWSEPTSVDDWTPPGQRAFDQMMDAEDAKWRADRKKELGG